MQETLAAPRPAPLGRLGRLISLEQLVLGGAALALVLLVLVPVLFLLYGALTDQDQFSLQHFQDVFSKRLYYQALLNSLTLGLGAAVFSVLVGVPMAWAVSRTNMPLKGPVRLLVAVSYVTPPFLSAIAYVALLSPNAGIINRLLVQTLGLEKGPFNAFSIEGLILVTTMHTFPYVFLLTASALESVDASLEESAQVLGAGKLRTALQVTIPLMAPAVLSGALLAFVNAIALFGSQAIMGMPGRVYTLPTRIYALFNYPPEYGLASALSLLFVALTVLALYLQRSYLARRSYVTLSGKGVRPQLLDVGAFKYLLLAFCGLIFLLSVALPYLSLLALSLSKSWGLAFWENLTLANFQFILFEYEPTQRAILNSLVLATAAATLAVLLGALISYLDLRTETPGRKFLDYVSLIPLGLPGIVIAVALIQFWLRAPVNIYGTMLILLLAYVARYVPLGVRAANSSIRQVDPSLEETARITGGSWLRTMTTVTLPLIRPGLFAGWLLIFVPALQELSASILLFTSDTVTLAVAVYNLYETGYLEPVAALAILNALIIGAAIWIASRIGGRPMAGGLDSGTR